MFACPSRSTISEQKKGLLVFSQGKDVAFDTVHRLNPGIRIMTNKPFLRSSSSPGISNLSSSPASERISNPTRRGSDGSQRVNQRHMPSSQTVLAPLPYWVAEGAPLVAHNLPSGEVQMMPVQATTPGMQGMVPVMATPGAATSQQTGNKIPRLCLRLRRLQQV